jgi:hypothetical protein
MLNDSRARFSRFDTFFARSFGKFLGISFDLKIMAVDLLNDRVLPF